MTTATRDPALQHMPGCRCEADDPAAFADDPDAFMSDERGWTSWNPEPHIDSLLSMGLLHTLETAARAAGVPFERVYESRWNARGEAIGPKLEVRICELIEHRELCRLVSDAMEETVRRMVESRGQSR